MFSPQSHREAIPIASYSRQSGLRRNTQSEPVMKAIAVARQGGLGNPSMAAQYLIRR
jgi:hypothetical protein